MTRSFKRLPYRVYYLPVLFLTITGIIDSAYLSLSHYRNYTDLTYSSFCAISKAINCDTVAQSSWSILFGVPVALMGLFGFTLFLLILIPLRKPRSEQLPLWSVLVVLGFLYSITALFFGYISAEKIESYCIFCIASYAISFSLFYFSWLIRRRFSSTSLLEELSNFPRCVIHSKKLFILVVVFITASIFTSAILPPYWELTHQSLNVKISNGVTDDGHAWIGAEQPVVTITEFSDYMCFQCSKMHFFIRRLVEKYPDRIRLVHRHFPMDHQYNPLVEQPFHSGSGKMAIIALYAQSKGKFWEASDLLFNLARQKTDFNSRIIAEALEISKIELVQALNKRRYRLMLKHDIAEGIDRGIIGTPGFIIEDNVYNGHIPKSVMNEIHATLER